jgi:hypothetical protein
MKVVICGSMSASKEMLSARDTLVALGHNVIVPDNTVEYARMSSPDKTVTESARDKAELDLIKGYFDTINNNDAILVVNVEKNEVAGYIGANAFLEMGFAHVLGKKIFLLNQYPKTWHTDEIQAMQPIILNGNLENLS